MSTYTNTQMTHAEEKEKSIMTKTLWVGLGSFVMGTIVGSLVTLGIKRRSATPVQADEDDFDERYAEHLAARNERILRNEPPVKNWEKVGEKISEADAEPFLGSVRPQPNLTRAVSNEYEAAKTAYHLAGSKDILGSNEVKGEEEDMVDPLDGVDAEDFDEDADLSIPGEGPDGEEPLSMSEPYLIDYEDFYEEDPNPKQEKIILFYYVQDDIVADENDEIMPEPDEFIGVDALPTLEMATNVWVRNERLGIDYEIIRTNGSYEMQLASGNDPRKLAEKARREGK